MKFDAIIAIASGQADPLILPFLSPEIECKHLVLLVSEWSKSKKIDENIAKALKPNGIKVTSVNLPSDDWAEIQNTLDRTLKNYPDKKIVFNSNGGTKPMTLAAYEYCYNENIPVFYVDNNKLDWLYNADMRNLKGIEIEASLAMSSYLVAHGYDIISDAPLFSSADYKALVNDWTTDKNKSEKGAIGVLNYIASRGDKNKLTVPLEGKEKDENHPVGSLLDDLDRVGLIELFSEKIRFKSEEARFFANGGWYELYVCSLLQTINKRHFDGKGKIITSLIVKPTEKTEKEVKNEIDVAFLLSNRLYLFECKTANISGKNGRADAAIYKLGTLLNSLGGIRAKGIIMSYRDIDIRDTDRARLLNIDIVDHSNDIKVMEERVRKIIGG
ncbi:DUF1887 family CARF protein [uncultured Psychromonas sp.]|uniref:Card1-like endonuclease domain-containing protein n=1 Tax=uncultured Psychromonas sp. TaxID=173974 RepID=UPI002605CA25|nr:DUF1887 family CARF protein [uncultured Psychromonas sp.]